MKRTNKLRWVLIAIIIALVFSSIAYYFFKTETNEIRGEKYAYLEAISDLKVDQVTKWRTERLSEAQFFPSVGRVIKSTVFLSKNKNDKESNTFLDETLRPIQQRHKYRNIFITDLKHNIIFSLRENYHDIDSITSNAIDKAIGLDSIMFLDFYFCNIDSTIHLDIVSPITDNDGTPIGAMIFRFDPKEYLYPLIQKWPTPTSSAESYLIRNEVTHVRLLSDVRFKNNSALLLKIALTNTEYVSVQGALDKKGILEGIDYRGIPVLASIKKISGTNWSIVSKIDQNEIYEDLRYRAGSITLITVIAFLLVGAVILYLYKYRQSHTYKNLFLREKELSETREEYKTALYSIGDAVITTDKLGKVQRMNAVASNLTGWKEKDAAGRNLEDVFKIINEETRQTVINPVKRVLHSGTIVGLANHTLLISKDGKEIPIADSGSPITDKENNILGVILVFRDQTEEREKERALFESSEKFEKIFQHSSDSISLTEITTGKLIEINDGFEKMFGYTREEAIGKTVFELNLWADTSDRESILKKLKESGRVKNYEAYGIKKDGSKLTALISGELLSFNNTKYILLTIKDITERKIFEDSLKMSEEKYKMLLEFASDAFFQGDSEGNFITVNDQSVRLTGYSREELLEMNIKDIFSKEVLDDIPLRYDRLMAGEIIKSERVVTRKDGTVITVEMTSKRMPDGTYQSFFRDITDRKHIENNLKESEERFRKAFITSPDSIVINRISDGEYISVNQGFTEITGYKPEEVIGKNSVDIDIWENFEERERFYDLLKQSGIIKNIEARFRIKNGDIRTGSLSAAIIELNNELHVISITRDISEQKKAIEKLKSSEYNLRNSQRVALIGHYEFDVATGNWSASEMLDEIFGIDNNYPHNTEGWGNLLHPDDRQMMLDHLLNDVVKSRGDFNKEYRIVRYNDKETRWMYGQGKLEIDVNNNPKMMFGTIQDITDRKKAEEEKLKTKVHYQKIIENAPDGIVQISADGKFKYVSPSAKRIFHHPIDKRVENEPNELTHPDDLPLVLETLTNIIQDPSIIPTIEYRFKDYYGEYIWIESTFNNLLSEPSVESIVINFRDISFRKKAEIELLEKFRLEEQISKIARTAPGGLCSFKLDTNGKISMLFVSDAWCEIYNFKQEDVIDDASKIFTRIHPDDAKQVSESIKKSAETLEDWQDEFRIVNPVKGIIWVEGHSTPSKENDGTIMWHGFITDITARKSAEERLRTLSRAVEQSPAIIVITDINGDIEFVNPKFTEVTGYEFNQVIGKNPRILKSGNTSKEEYKTLWKTISEGKEWRGEFLNKRKNGEFYWESAFITPILNSAGKIINYIALKEDITERKKLITDLIEAKEKAEEMNRIKAYFFANMSHELRTPFVGIVGFSELLSESLTNPDEKEMAEQILKSSKRLTDTLNKILNVTRLEFDKIDLRIREVNIIELAEQIRTLFSKSAENKNLEIKTKYANDTIIVTTDGRLIEEILSNLVNNAVKYTNKGYIEISAELKPELDRDNLILKVQDTGVGIPKSKQEMIWQEFRQVSEGMNRSFEGTGLGLTITKKYLEILNGTVLLESELGKGSTFTIIIPIQKTKTQQIEKKVPILMNTKINETVPQSRKPKILYVEDDAIALSYVEKVLRTFYEIDTAFNANIALELVNKNKYEAMLLDINLGKGIDGVELMQLIRKNSDYEKLPIVAVTAYAAESDRLEFLSKGFTHYLSKPFTSVDLRGVLSKIFN